MKYLNLSMIDKAEKRRETTAKIILALVIAFWMLAGPALAAATTELASVDDSGAQGNQVSLNPAMSASGEFVAFASDASNLVPGDTNGSRDIFLRNIDTGTTERVSVDSSGVQGNAASFDAVINNDGDFVAFTSSATNLVSEDGNGRRDIFLRDVTAGTTELVSVASDETQGNAHSRLASISADGDVAFSSDASNLVPGDTNGFEDVFVRDRSTGTTQRMSVSTVGAQANAPSTAPSISANTGLALDGRFVAFSSSASNLVPADTNGQSDVFVHDRPSARTVRVSVSSSGGQANGPSADPSIAGGGDVAFASSATNLVAGDTNGFDDIFRRDFQDGDTQRVSISSGGVEGNADSYDPAISRTVGSEIVFTSVATNLVPNDTNGAPDIFEWSVFFESKLHRVSLSSGRIQANSGSFHADLSPSGHYVTFDSTATNLVTGDTNGYKDVFLHTN